MIFRWEAKCEFTNLFMPQNGMKRTVEVKATKEVDARKAAQLKVCSVIGVSTMMHGSVRVHQITNRGRA